MFVLPKEVIFIYQLIGGFPLMYTFETSRRNRNIVFSPKLFLCGLTAVVIQISFTLSAVFIDYTGILEGKPLRMSTRTSIVTNFLDLTSYNMMVVIVFISSTLKYSSFREMCLTLDRVDHNLKQKVQESNTKRKVFLVAINSAILITVSKCYELWRYKLSHDDNMYAMYYPTIIVPCTVILGLVVHFTYVAGSISTRFRIVNKKLEKEVFNHLHVEKKKIPSLPPVDVTLRNGFSLYETKSLMNTYWLLCDAVTGANAFYGWPLLVVIFTLFLQIIITIDYIFRDIWPIIEPENVPHIFTQFHWCFTFLLHLFFIVSSGTVVNNAVDETGFVICKLMNKGISLELKKQLASLLRQLPRHNARFSALGFFQIHNHILTSIAGLVTTYLMILIQFHTAAKSEDY